MIIASFKIILAFILFSIVFSCFVEPLQAQSQQQPEDSLSMQRKSEQDFINKFEKKFSEERQSFERQLDRHAELIKHASDQTQKSVDLIIQVSIYALVAIFAIGAIAYRFIFVNKLTEVRQQIEETFENRARKQLDSKLLALDTHLDRILPERIEGAIGQKLKGN